MKQLFWRTRFSAVSWKLILIVAGAMQLSTGCAQKEKKPEVRSEPSKIKVVVNDGGPVVFTTRTAEFQVLPSGYVQAFLSNEGTKLSLDEPGESSPANDYLVQDGKEVRFKLDFRHTKVTDAAGKLGRGKHVEIPAQGVEASAAGLQRTLQIDVYDDFPNLLLSSVVYMNTGRSDYHIDTIIEQQHRFDSHVLKKPYDMCSFHGSSYEWGKDDVVKLTSKFSQPNVMGGIVKGGYGGGIPVVAFWTASVGEAIGHIETLPLSLSLPRQRASRWTCKRRG